MKIIEYKLHANTDGSMSIPGWVANGGYFQNPDDYTMISANPDTTEYFVPDTVTLYDAAELKARQVAIHAKYPMQKQAADLTFEDMTDAEVESAVDTWIAAN